MDKLHIFIAAFGILLFLWFSIPCFVGILNIGNVTGMVLAGMLAGYGRFYTQIHSWVISLWQRTGGRLLVAVVVILAVVILLIAAAETLGMIGAVNNPAPMNTTAVVLGCSVKGSRPSTILRERIEAAYEYLKKNPGAQCVLSGGQGKGEDISEAECMYRALVERGIESNRLIVEDKSVNTEENLRFSKQLLEEHGINGNITIVTSEFHALRAAQMAKHLGITSYSTPSRTFLLYLPTYYVRELYGILYYTCRSAHR